MLNFDEISRESIEQLVNSGVDINSTGTYHKNDSYTLLHAAIDNGDVESIKFILTKNPNVNGLVKNYGPINDDGDGDDSDCDDDSNDDKSFRNYSALHLAVIKNRVDIVELLLSNGADVNIEIENCHSVINTAIKTEKIELIQLLLESGADVNGIHFFTVEPKKQTYYLDNSPIPPKRREFTPLLVAIKRGNLEIIKLLINKGADPNIKALNNKFPLIMAVCDGSYEIAEYLLEHGADVNCKNQSGYYIGYPALNFALQNDRFDLVKLLVSHGAETKDKGIAIYLALEKENFEIVKFLIKFGFDINDPDNHGMSETVPLNIALEQANFETIELLLINGANINSMITPDEHVLTIYWEGEMNEFLHEHIVKVRVLKAHTGDLENVDLSSSEVELTNEGWAGSADEEEVEIYNAEKLWSEEYGLKCEEEIQTMKTKMIGTSCLSYYELLKKNIYQLGMYAKNFSITAVLSSDEIKETFPIYGAIIKNCFEKGLLRKELLEQVEKRLSDILSKLPYSVVIEVFSYLKNEDIKHFAKYLNN